MSENNGNNREIDGINNMNNNGEGTSNNFDYTEAYPRGYQQDDQYYNKTNQEYSNQSYNQNYNQSNYEYTNQSYNSEGNSNSNINSVSNNKSKKNPNKKGGKKAAKVVGIVASMVIVSFSGGLLGGYLANSGNSTANNSAKSASYAAPEFLSSDDGETLTVAQAIEKVKPAVVTISTKTIVPGNYFTRDTVQEGIGSGFIINEDGYILTNYHVVEGANEVSVLLSTGEEVEATVVNYNQEKDIAMVKLADGVKVPGVATLGDSDALYAGQEVIAIGTPLSTEFSATSTKGIISAINRDVETETGVTMNLIQTDAAINPGNSGGPLINSNGEVIGINSMKLVTTEVEGIGFAIPIKEAADRIDTLSKPIITLGISVMEINDELSKQNDLPVGLLVKDVTDFSAAQKAGMKIYDVITEFDGKSIKTVDDLSKAKEDKEIGDKVKVKVYRNDKEVELEMTLE